MGGLAEEFVSGVCAAYGFEVRPNLGEPADFDYELAYGQQKTTIEVKFDLYAERSGNIAIEFYNPKGGKPSGIERTKAVWWVHVLAKNHLPSEAYAIECGELRRLIREKPPPKIVPEAGDGNSSIYLYPRSFLEKNFTSLENVLQATVAE